ncbi:MAG TPA: hypothetical protein VF708_19225 [Pyrinomonadaceae bacterium]
MRFPLPIALKLRATRFVVAAILMLALLSGLAPSSASSSSSSPSTLCTMACCAGKPPHEAGSCASVIACHVNLKTGSKRPRLESTTIDGTGGESTPHHHVMMHVPDVPLSDAASYGHLQGKAHHPSHHDAHQNAPGRKRVVTATILSGGCRQDCGAGVFSSSGEGRQRDPAHLSHAGQPRPFSKARPSLSERNLDRTLNVLRGKLIPRAPPTFS